MKIEAINRCRDLDMKTVRAFVERQDRHAILALLLRLAEVSRPQEGAGLALLVLTAVARYATWLPDRLHILLNSEGERTRLDVQAGIGEVRERLWSRITFVFHAPLEEFFIIAAQLERREENPLEFSRESRDGKAVLVADMKDRPREPSLPPLSQRMAERTMQMLERVKRTSLPPAPGKPPSILPLVHQDTRERQALRVPDMPVIPCTGEEQGDAQHYASNASSPPHHHPDDPELTDTADIDDDW